MKIRYIQLSNVLSFRYVDDIATAEKLSFADDLNILIGQNGSGKSTALEAINFLFKRVLFKQYNINQELYARRSSITSDERKTILSPVNNKSFAGFRLEPNWNDEEKPQRIRIQVELDAIDESNIKLLTHNITALRGTLTSYSSREVNPSQHSLTRYTLDVDLQKQNKSFSVSTEVAGAAQDFGYQYLVDYNFFKEAIAIHNQVHVDAPVPILHESFTLISSYRNYHAFQPSVSLRDAEPAQQIQAIRISEYAKSLNAIDSSEPSIFGLVRLLVAQAHFLLSEKKLDAAERETGANSLPFMRAINQRLAIVNLECKIRLIDRRTWDYAFEFIDKRRSKVLTDINSLSSGQKAIIHLIFEAYGRGQLKGGVVVIDEPEIHLHYQFQHEYLRVIEELNRDQSCQYILVTHSEALINSSTIRHVKRFALDGNGHTRLKAPMIAHDQRALIQILDNTRSTYAFFASKVVLVEGDSDRYFFRAALQHIHPGLGQEIAVLHIGGKNNFGDWRRLFRGFGLQVYSISDFDYITVQNYPAERGARLREPAEIAAFKAAHPDWTEKVAAGYARGAFILREGTLEHYLGISQKGLSSVIDFCQASLQEYLLRPIRSPLAAEIEDICRRIAAEPSGG